MALLPLLMVEPPAVAEIRRRWRQHKSKHSKVMMVMAHQLVPVLDRHPVQILLQEVVQMQAQTILHRPVQVKQALVHSRMMAPPLVNRLRRRNQDRP